MATIVTYNRGAQVTRPHEAYAESGQSIFTEWLKATDDLFTIGGTTAAAPTYGSTLKLDATGVVTCAAASELFAPQASVNFAAKTRMKIVWGTNDVVSLKMAFQNNSTDSPTEAIGFNLALTGGAAGSNEAVTVSCSFDDGAADLSEVVSATELGGALSIDGWNDFSVLVDCDGSRVTAKYFINGKQVKEIAQAGFSTWATAGLTWCQTNLTSGSLHDPHIDWISIGSSIRP